jgi:hypothetical protein
MTYVSKEELLSRIDNEFQARLIYWPPGAALALHAWPKCGVDGFCGIGPVIWGELTESWFDVRTANHDGDDYHRINRMLAEICHELGVRYLNMA